MASDSERETWAQADTIKCPTCGNRAKKLGAKYPTWYRCANPSCNMTVFEHKS